MKRKTIVPMSWKTKIVIGTVLCTMLICVFVADDWQQKRFATLRHGYYSMEQEQYEEAVGDFEEYLHVVYNNMDRIPLGATYRAKKAVELVVMRRLHNNRTYGLPGLLRSRPIHIQDNNKF